METGLSPEQRIAAFRDLMDLHALGEDRFTIGPHPRGRPRLFGGQVIAQAMQAAELTMDDDVFRPHSLHAYFLRPGSEILPIEYAVERNLEGRTFRNRRVVASQAGKILFTMAMSFHREGQALDHRLEMPDVQPPEDLPGENEVLETLLGEKADMLNHFSRSRPFEVRIPVSARQIELRTRDEPYYYWFRSAAPLGNDPRHHRGLLGYASDFGLLIAAAVRHGRDFFRGDTHATSLDHAVWLHEPGLNADDWLLYSTDSPWAGLGRAFARGNIFTRDGQLVASVAQEGMISLA
jgi:acyl-CoA thioesterase-2